MLTHFIDNKLAMGRSFQIMAENGLIHAPNTEGGNSLKKQLKKYSSGRYDNKTDAYARHGSM